MEALATARLEPAHAYFFLGPLLTIGALGGVFVLLPPFLDIAHLHGIWRIARLTVRLVAVATAVATAAGSIRAASLFLEAGRAVDGFVSAGLERNLCFLTAARARRAEHLARPAASAVGRSVPTTAIRRAAFAS